MHHLVDPTELYALDQLVIAWLPTLTPQMIFHLVLVLTGFLGSFSRTAQTLGTILTYGKLAPIPISKMV
jgi:hypothetical protein